MKLASRISALALIVALASGPLALAQAAPKPASDATTAKPATDTASAKPAQDSAPRPRPYYDSYPTRTFYLKYANQPADANEIVTAIRNLVSPEDKVYFVPSQAAIMMRAPADDFTLVQKVLDDLDRPRKAWRLTYTITEMDGEKLIGTQHYSMDLVDGQQARLEQSSKVPAPTGTYSAGGPSGPAPNAAIQTTYGYQDVGITFNATLVPQGTGARLQSDIVQNGVANSGSASGLFVLRDSTLKGAYLLTSGKPLVLGAMDVPGSTHHLQIEALIEPLP